MLCTRLNECTNEAVPDIATKKVKVLKKIATCFSTIYLVRLGEPFLHLVDMNDNVFETDG